MNWNAYLVAALTVAAAAAAMSLRNVVHCALCAALAFVGVALLFLQLGAEFAGLAQVLVYVGAIAILIVFAILLTRSAETLPRGEVFSLSWPLGLGAAAAALAVMLIAILRSPSLERAVPAPASATVRDIGGELMTRYLLPLEVLGLLLTAAMIGAAVLSMREKGDRK